MANALEPTVAKPLMEVKDKFQGKKTPGKKTPESKKSSITIIVSLVLIVALAAGSIVLFNGGISKGADSLMNSFSAAFTTEKDAAYEKLYQAAFDRAEQKYHVSNEVVISIGNLEESQKLEVLKASDVEFITEDKDNNSGNVTAWLEVNGEGTFVIDLQAAEYIVDNERRYVLVRIPNPELTNIKIKSTTRRLFSDDFKNGSYSEGVDLALKQRNEAQLQIQKSLMSNQYIYSNAKDVAVGMIKNLVRQFNPDIPDLTVDVEFMD